MEDRTRRLEAALKGRGSAGILIHKPSNMFYLSGFTGEGLLVLAPGIRAIVTDFRYVEQARQQSPGFAVESVSPKVSHAQIAARLLRDAGLGKALYEDDEVTVRDAARLSAALGDIALEALDMAPEALRRVKDAQELALLEKANDISSRAFEEICGVIKPGMTEIAIRRALEDLLLDFGSQAAAFHTIVASGPNGSLPHAIPGERRVQEGDMVTLDFGAKYGGYCADITRTVSVGQPGAEMAKIYAIVQEAQAACQDALAPGKPCREVDAIARKIIGDAGYGDMFGHGLGHSVGIDIHEEPRLNQTSTDVLEPGIVITVEPGIYVPGLGGVRIENTCVVTETGARSLAGASRDLRIL
ncbi:MAG TPA: Xaa-Pro peptidase family protein [Candidatus Limnocylindria bacterium]|nr:Xaa-Pro peptidase family protein [Candidatus Limnocylindria bacterium]